MKTPLAHCIVQYGTFTTSIAGLATTSDGMLMAIAPEEGDIEVRDVSTGSRLCSIPVPVSIAQSVWNSFGGASEISSLALSDDGLFLAASSFKTGDISVWTFEGECVGRIKGDGSFTRTVSFLPNTSLLIVALRDTRIQLWDAEKQQLHATLPGADEKDASVQQMVWLSQSNLLATAGLKKNDGSGINTVKLWQLTL